MLSQISCEGKFSAIKIVRYRCVDHHAGVCFDSDFQRCVLPLTNVFLGVDCWVRRKPRYVSRLSFMTDRFHWLAYCVPISCTVASSPRSQVRAVYHDKYGALLSKLTAINTDVGLIVCAS